VKIKAIFSKEAEIVKDSELFRTILNCEDAFKPGRLKNS
jgi:hypothetical protein